MRHLYVALAIVVVILAVFGGFKLLNTYYGAYSVPSTSMEPTILKDEKILVRRGAYANLPPTRGDVVVVQHGQERLFTVKRVIALEGDKIEVRNKEVFLNGHKLIEPYVVHRGPVLSSFAFLDNFGPLAIPDGLMFLMGDNRDVAMDSRHPGFGLVPTSELRGKVMEIAQSPVAGRRGTKVR